MCVWFHQATQLQTSYNKLCDDKRNALDTEAAARARAEELEGECVALSARLNSLSARLDWRAAAVDKGQPAADVTTGTSSLHPCRQRL